jgi:hypothetical protein
MINLQLRFDYFSNLNKKTNFSGKDLIDKLEAIENEKIYSELDNKITTKEISNPFLNMGTIIPFAHDVGNIPVVKTESNNLCKHFRIYD